MHAGRLGRLTSSYTTENGVMVGHRKNFGGKQTFADYSYDNIGNIKHAEYKYDSVPYTFVDYNYDRYNQLTKEVHSPLSMGIDLRSAEYAYDEFGNITDVTRTDSSGKVTKNRYVYSDKTGWQDLLTSYNGHTITYDEIGNPLSYYNGWTYTLRWDAGRRLSRSSAGGIYVDYSYNKDGIRTKKTVSNKYTDRYILDGDKLVGLERTRKGSTVKDTYYFIYDEMGTIWEAICYVGGATEPVRYFYRTNAQGDVKQIVDKDNMLSPTMTTTHGAASSRSMTAMTNRYPATPTLQMLTPSATADMSTIMRRDSITCRADTTCV